jgi:hypothetical protein
LLLAVAVVVCFTQAVAVLAECSKEIMCPFRVKLTQSL